MFGWLVFHLQLTGTETLEGQECNVWRTVVKEGGKRNVYTLWQSVSTQLPVRYEMFGYDNLLGSHYDKYYIDYIHVDVQKSLDDAIFTTPASEYSCLYHSLAILFLLMFVHLSYEDMTLAVQGALIIICHFSYQYWHTEIHYNIILITAKLYFTLTFRSLSETFVRSCCCWLIG